MLRRACFYTATKAQSLMSLRWARMEPVFRGAHIDPPDLADEGVKLRVFASIVQAVPRDTAMGRRPQSLSYQSRMGGCNELVSTSCA